MTPTEETKTKEAFRRLVRLVQSWPDPGKTQPPADGKRQAAGEARNGLDSPIIPSRLGDEGVCNV